MCGYHHWRNERPKQTLLVVQHPVISLLFFWLGPKEAKAQDCTGFFTQNRLEKPKGHKLAKTFGGLLAYFDCVAIASLLDHGESSNSIAFFTVFTAQILLKPLRPF